MKREEKNVQSLHAILESARKEFSRAGYGLSSINTICSEGGISKGNLYHYFKDKDAVYLACVQDCFDALVAVLRAYAQRDDGDAREMLEGYFDARLLFFESHPEEQRLFCEAVVSPPWHLAGRIQGIRGEFDRLNLEILDKILSRLDLRPDIRREEVVQVFRQYQDLINTGCAGEPGGTGPLEREERCRRALDILLYGVVAREGFEHGQQ